MQNYIFFESENEKDDAVYRIFGIERLLSIFDTKLLTLVKPKKWDDPFENFILKSKASFINGENVTFGFANHIFGQCWSLHKETDAMWRIYSHEKNGVKVKSTSKKLRESLASKVENPELSAFIGKVLYKNEKELTSMTQDRTRMQHKIFDTSGRGHAEALLFKRKEFTHEKEVRLIYSGKEADAASDIFSYEINPYELIEEIVFDPRMDKLLAKIYEAHFKGIGFQGKITQSNLYAMPNLTVQI